MPRRLLLLASHRVFGAGILGAEDLAASYYTVVTNADGGIYLPAFRLPLDWDASRDATFQLLWQLGTSQSVEGQSVVFRTNVYIQAEGQAKETYSRFTRFDLPTDLDVGGLVSTELVDNIADPDNPVPTIEAHAVPADAMIAASVIRMGSHSSDDFNGAVRVFPSVAIPYALRCQYCCI